MNDETLPIPDDDPIRPPPRLVPVDEPVREPSLEPEEAPIGDVRLVGGEDEPIPTDADEPPDGDEPPATVEPWRTDDEPVADDALRDVEEPAAPLARIAGGDEPVREAPDDVDVPWPDVRVVSGED